MNQENWEAKLFGSSLIKTDQTAFSYLGFRFFSVATYFHPQPPLKASKCLKLEQGSSVQDFILSHL